MSRTQIDEAILESCPFCGGDAVFSSAYDNEENVYTLVECLKCSAMSDSFTSDKEAVAAWNLRVK